MSDDRPGPESGKTSHPLQSKSLVASIAVVATIVVMGAVVSVTTLFGDDDPPGASPQAKEGGPYEGSIAPDEAPEQDIPRSDGSTSVCGLKDSEKTSFDSFDDIVTWDRVGLMEAPSFPAHGPKKTTQDGYRYCYAKSPEGAVSAGMNYLAMTGDPAAIPEVAKQMYAEGPGRKAAMESLEDGGADSAASTPGDMAGVRLLAFGTDRARVDVAMSFPDLGDDVFGSVVVDLRWEDGDWKVVTRDSGEMVIAPSTITGSLAGYVETGMDEA